MCLGRAGSEAMRLLLCQGVMCRRGKCPVRIRILNLRGNARTPPVPVRRFLKRHPTHGQTSNGLPTLMLWMLTSSSERQGPAGAVEDPALCNAISAGECEEAKGCDSSASSSPHLCRTSA